MQLKSILDTVCIISGQVIKISKSLMYVSRNALDDNRELPKLIFNFSLEEAFGSYLGVPIVLPREKFLQFSLLLDFMQ